LPHLRWNPVLREWVIASPHRQARPTRLREGCPFCPPSQEVEGEWEVRNIPNLYPAFSLEHEELPEPGGSLYRVKEARGVCEVVVTSRRHEDSLANMSTGQIEKIIMLYAERTRALLQAGFEYVYVFENSGAAVGVTLTHPHSQIYAMPFTPHLVERETHSSKEFLAKEGRCLFCAILGEELSSRSRVVAENEGFVAFIPFYARWALETHIYPKRHLGYLHELHGDETRELAALLGGVVRGFNAVYGFPLSYVMAVHQAPRKAEVYHLHIEFYPPHRDAERLKYLAGIELGGGIFLADTVPEETACILRKSIQGQGC